MLTSRTAGERHCLQGEDDGYDKIGKETMASDRIPENRANNRGEGDSTATCCGGEKKARRSGGEKGMSHGWR